ncbi:competence protein ComGF [Streptococcus cristatus]|uniref:Competence protein ComGF n=2 Tax=Streptococcus cristatus TaxID=45634 RepID=A0A512AE19_STRCR|nr:competence type IV pilus minor pilin ComGF [Streptococcus cristatus]AGK72026.1 competence protein ComGF [Streptococcus cristatus AS 1.3089]GEN97943.1 competence protein ComGF [Streptococcus cristatus]SQI49916.1 competence protein ComGF [Streptococcus cristatus]
MLKNVKIKAFTLLETLVALLVLSGSMLVFQSLTKLLAFELRQQQENKQQEWLLFVDQLETELSRSQFDRVENDKIYVKQDGKNIALGKSRSDDFRKTDASGRGYQPMVYGLKAAPITQKGNLVRFRFQFENDLEREYIYRVQDKS